MIKRKLPFAYHTKSGKLRGRRVLLSMNGWYSPNWPQRLHCVDYDLRQRATAISLRGIPISALMAQSTLLFTQLIALTMHRLYLDVIRLTCNAQKSGSIATSKTIVTRRMRKVDIYCQCCKRLVFSFLGLAYANTAVTIRALVNKQTTCSVPFVQRQRIQNPKARQEGDARLIRSQEQAHLAVFPGRVGVGLTRR